MREAVDAVILLCWKKQATGSKASMSNDKNMFAIAVESEVHSIKAWSIHFRFASLRPALHEVRNESLPEIPLFRLKNSPQFT